MDDVDDANKEWSDRKLSRELRRMSSRNQI